MKKFLSLLLTLSMLLSMFAVSAVSVSATDGENATEVDDRLYPIEAGAETYTIGEGEDAVTYTVIWDADDFFGMATEGNYILGGNIDITEHPTNGGYGFWDASASNYVSVWALVLEGNNCSVTGLKDMNGSTSIFGLLYGGFITLRNLTFGTAAEKLQITNTMTSGIGTSVLVSCIDKGSTLTCENVTIYADIDASRANAGFFAGSLRDAAVTVTLTNCAAYGTVKATGTYSGFVGWNRESSTNNVVSLYNCTLGVTGTQGDGVCANKPADTVRDLTVATPAIEISTAEQFLAISGYYNYKLTENIDLGGEAFSGKTWAGTLDGNGHSVTNFTTAQGMFDSTDYVNRTFKNITFGTEGAPIGVTASANYAGLLAGKIGANSNVSLEAVKAYVNVAQSGNRSAVGGFFGGNESAGKTNLSFVNCEIEGTLDAHLKLGGYVGTILSDTATIKFANCVNGVDVSGLEHVAGFIGRVRINTMTIENCINEGNMTANHDWTAATHNDSAGAAIGQIFSGTITVENFVNTGDIGTDATNNTEFAANRDKIGGVIAYLHKGDVKVSNTLNIGAIGNDNATSVGAVIGWRETSVTNSVEVTNAYTLNDTLKGTSTNDHTATAVTAEQLASGEVAFLLGDGFGQVIGTDAIPVPGGAEVAKRVLGEDTYYANLLPNNGESAEIYVQYSEVATGMHSQRILVRVNESDLTDATGIAFKVQYVFDGGTKGMMISSFDEISFYRIIRAADGLYTGEEGTVIMAVVIENIPDTAWDSVNVSLSITGSDADIEANANISNRFSTAN